MKKVMFTAFAVGLSLTANFWAQVPNYVPTNGLVGWWPFNGNANDGSGNNLNANVIGANLTVDRFGIPNSAYNFDYTTVGFSTQTDEIYIPYSPILNSSAVSISIWVYQRQFVWAGNTNPPMSTLAARFQYGSSGQVWMLNSGTNGISGFSGAPNITLNSWTHILTTFENGTGKIYINGQLISTTNNLAALNVTGNSTGGSSITGSPHGLSSAGTVNFVGNAFAGVTNNSFIAGINITLTGNLTFTGNATALGLRTYGIQCAGNGIFNGTITGGNSNLSAGVNLPSGIHTINSNVTGGGTASCHGIITIGGTLTVNGTCTGGAVSAFGAQLTTTTATFNGDIIGSSSSSAVGLNVSDAASNVTISTMTFSTIGTLPVAGFIKFKNTAPTVTVRKANNTNQTLVDPSTTDIPIVGNVRDGIVYATGSLTGTFKVPSPLTVALGVPTDNTVGSGVITIGDMGTLLASYIV